MLLWVIDQRRPPAALPADFFDADAFMAKQLAALTPDAFMANKPKPALIDEFDAFMKGRPVPAESPREFLARESAIDSSTQPSPAAPAQSPSKFLRRPHRSRSTSMSS